MLFTGNKIFDQFLFIIYYLLFIFHQFLFLIFFSRISPTGKQILEEGSNFNLYYFLNLLLSLLFIFKINRSEVVDKRKDRMELVQLYRKMISEISIEDRKYRLKVYPKCFLGKEAVEWLKNKAIDEKEKDRVKKGKFYFLNILFIFHSINQKKNF